MKLGLIKFFLFHSFATRGGNWVQILKTKLLYAIESESGFELSWNVKKNAVMMKLGLTKGVMFNINIGLLMA